MSLPSTVSFQIDDTDYVTKLNQLVTDLNLAYAAFIASQSGSLFSDTSTTSNTVGTGSKSWTLAAGTQRAFAVGMTVRVVDSANPANYCEGQVTAYSHPSITINVTTTGGSGTKTSWVASIAATTGAITTLGPGSATAAQFVVVSADGLSIVGLTAPPDGISDPAFWMGAQ